MIIVHGVDKPLASVQGIFMSSLYFYPLTLFLGKRCIWMQIFHYDLTRNRTNWWQHQDNKWLASPNIQSYKCLEHKLNWTRLKLQVVTLVVLQSSGGSCVCQCCIVDMLISCCFHTPFNTITNQVCFFQQLIAAEILARLFDSSTSSPGTKNCFNTPNIDHLFCYPNPSSHHPDSGELLPDLKPQNIFFTRLLHESWWRHSFMESVFFESFDP